MSLQTEIEKIFKESSNYSNPGQAVNQASSLNALSGDLYTDSRRFIYELLQNADDSVQDNNSVNVWIKLFDDYLVVAHTGRAFDARDLRGICNVNNGTKKSDSTKTGYKGIGFKSVFGQSEHVIIFTNGEYFRFDSSFDFGWSWEEPQEDWEQHNERKFQFPWQIIPIYTEPTEILGTINQYFQQIEANVATVIRLNNAKETKQAIQNLSQNLNMFLFLKNIAKIHFDVSNPISIEIDRTQQNRISLKQNEELKANWLINTITLQVPNELKITLQDERNIPEKLLNADSIELSLAAKIGKEGIIKLSAQERLLYAYLPTDETRYSLPVLVNTSFLTTANRESLHADSKWNQWLFNNIAIEIFKWISELVVSEFEYQAYRLIPDKTVSDGLGNEFNKGIDEALNTIPFIATNENELAKIEDTIIDFTFLSEKDFVGKSSVKNFIDPERDSTKKFAANTGFGSDFKRLGAVCFEWKNLRSFIVSTSFTNTHTIDKNIQLIKYFKNLGESDKVKDITNEVLVKLPFIWDHKNGIKCPTQICFPAPDDQNWNNPNSDLSFLHQELQAWLLSEPEMRLWLETIGMTEKTDITYITQTILPQVDNYVTFKNAIQVIQDLFILYRKGDLKEELIVQLSRIKLLTQEATLLPASDCYFSDFYNPRLKIEEVLEKDIFVNVSYCENSRDKDEWKRFFKMMGVNEGISAISHEKASRERLNQIYKFENKYFEEEDKYFQPWQTRFNADEYSELTTLFLLSHTSDFNFSKLLWSDVIANVELSLFDSPTIAFWGRTGYAGRNSGNEVANYLRWFVKNYDCLPTLMETCQKSTEVFINSKDIKSISGEYLPVFSGSELTPDWKSFFGFRTSLELSDYLDLLRKISLDVDDRGKVKKGNYERIQSIYSVLLDQCANWSSEDISKVEEWADIESLLNTKQQFTECYSLKYFIDGNESIFQDQFYFLAVNAENKNHPNFEDLLTYFKVKILKQSDFKLDYTQKELCSDLMDKLKAIIPYFKTWIDDEASDDKTKESLKNLQDKIETLNIYHAQELKIKYEDIDFSKNVNVHFNNRELFVTYPWDANSVLLKLSEVLCRYFYLLGHDKKLDFLLRSTIGEIRTYFIQESISMPEDISEIEIEEKTLQEHIDNSLADFDNVVDEGRVPLEEFFHTSKADYKSLKYAEKIIVRAVFNVLNHLQIIPEYDCTHAFKLASSIIGGITKNGNEITVVARPSDGGEVLPYYSSEFDVLEYVDAEFWCEDGINTPKQITLGQLLKKTGINRIPITNIDISGSDLELLVDNKKSETFDFNAVPYAPEKVARIISSFANTEGGTLIFGLKEASPTSNEIVGLSSDFRVVEIIKKAISLLSSVPTINYDWVQNGDGSIFVIQTEKADRDILLENQKYIRVNTNSVLEEKISEQQATLNITRFKKTIAIIIAIEDYKQRDENQISKVKYAQADALKFKNILIESMKIEENDIHTFINEDALKNDLEYDLSRLFHFLTEEDRLIFYYVGHGFHNGIENFLSTYDMHPYNISNTAVSLRKILLDPLQKSKCKNALIFIDACAQSFHDENERNQITDINDEEFLLLKNEFPYYATFLSCLPGQSSYSSDVLNNGIWTHHLVKAISGEVPEVIHNDKYITDTLLKDYLSSSVALYTKNELGYDQNPKAILDSSCENVIVELEEITVK